VSGLGAGTIRSLPSVCAPLSNQRRRAPRARPPGRRASASLASAAALLTVAALGGCGSSHTAGTAADPATLVPATATVYAGADVRPQGDERSSALAVGSALTRQSDPYLGLAQALRTPGSPPIDYESEVAPWLGRRAGVFVTSPGATGRIVALIAGGVLGTSSTGLFPFASGGTEGAFVLDTRDEGKARSFLTSRIEQAGAQATSYHGVAVDVAAGVAFAFVDHFVVIGSESGVKAAIDTAFGGPSLARGATYSKLQAAAPAGAIAHVYSNPATGPEGAPPHGPSGLLRLLTGARAANISLVPSATSVAIDVDAVEVGATGTPGGLLASAVEGGQAYDELPGESFLAVGLGHLGSTLGDDIEGLGEVVSLLSGLGGAGEGRAPSTALSLRGVLAGLLAPLGALAANSAQAKADFTSWMGSGGVFASGSSLLELKGAVVVESKNPALSRAAVSKLGALMARSGSSVSPASIPGTDAAVGVRVNGLPIVLYIANGTDLSGGTKFVIGLGEASVTDALTPPSTLATAASRAQAASILGEGIEPSLTVDVPSLVGILEAVGLGEEPTVSKLLPALRAITTVAGGGHSIGDGLERFRVVADIQQAGG